MCVYGGLIAAGWSVFRYERLQDDGRFVVEICVKKRVNCCCVCEARKNMHVEVLSGELMIGGCSEFAME